MTSKFRRADGRCTTSPMTMVTTNGIIFHRCTGLPPSVPTGDLRRVWDTSPGSRPSLCPPARRSPAVPCVSSRSILMRRARVRPGARTTATRARRAWSRMRLHSSHSLRERHPVHSHWRRCATRRQMKPFTAKRSPCACPVGRTPTCCHGKTSTCYRSASGSRGAHVAPVTRDGATRSGLSTRWRHRRPRWRCRERMRHRCRPPLLHQWLRKWLRPQVLQRPSQLRRWRRQGRPTNAGDRPFARMASSIAAAATEARVVRQSRVPAARSTCRRASVSSSSTPGRPARCRWPPLLPPLPTRSPDRIGPRMRRFSPSRARSPGPAAARTAWSRPRRSLRGSWHFLVLITTARASLVQAPAEQTSHVHVVATLLEIPLGRDVSAKSK